MGTQQYTVVTAGGEAADGPAIQKQAQVANSQVAISHRLRQCSSFLVL